MVLQLQDALEVLVVLHGLLYVLLQFDLFS